jgi:hypothetical protein
MRFSKPLAAAGILSTSLLTGMALTGAAYADTSHAEPRTTVHSHKSTTATLSATVTPGKVRRGGSYTVNIATTNISNGTGATVKGINGKTYTVTVKNGTAAKTLYVPSNIKYGSYQVTVTVGSLSDTADVTVKR